MNKKHENDERLSESKAEKSVARQLGGMVAKVASAME